MHYISFVEDKRSTVCRLWLGQGKSQEDQSRWRPVETRKRVEGNEQRRTMSGRSLRW